MFNTEHIEILRQGVEKWNEWRKANPFVVPELSDIDMKFTDLDYIDLHDAKLFRANLREARLYKADLRGAFLSSADLREADLSEADLSNADLHSARLCKSDLHVANLLNADLGAADLRGANLFGANLREVNLSFTKLSRADVRLAVLHGANLSWTDLSWTDLSWTDLRGSDLSAATLIETNFENADISKCRVFGISAWKLKVKNLKQANLIITHEWEHDITVDNLEVAQFVYLLIHNEKLRDVIDTLTTKSVLILGRFTTERKEVLDAIREKLRKRGYLPILFDFEKPSNRDLTETISILAHLSRFIIADITDAKSIPQELQAIVPDLPSVAIQPIILASQREYAMFEHFRGYRSVLELYYYETPETLIASFGEKVIEPAEAKVNELRPKAL